MNSTMQDKMTLKKSQYSSKIIVSSNTTSNKNGSKVTYTRRGVSVDTRSNNDNNNINLDNEVINIENLITQTTKGANRPTTGGSLMNFTHTKSQENSANSPRPNTDRISNSVVPNRSLAKSMLKYLPPKQGVNANKKTLVLDLDETLVHSGFKPFGTNSDMLLKIELDNKVHDIHVLVRPGVEEFLERMSKHFELVVFTASLSKYADPLVDKLDSKRLCFYRLFRQHCTEVNRAFVKDLKKLDRDLKDVIILDNSPISYALNVENGFPIKNWYDDRSDRELYNISPILEFLAYVPDVRDYIKRMVEKNEISYPKAFNLMNHYQLNNENINSNKSLSTKANNSSHNINIKNIKDFTYKPNVEISYGMNEIKLEQKDNSRYGSNLTNKERERNNFIEDRNLKREIDNKQNINIRIINNHINQFIIDTQDTLIPERNNMNFDYMKKQKNINTFRNSYNNHPQLQNNNNNNLNKNTTQNLINENLKQNPNDFNNYYNRFNLKNTNLNVGVEVKSPVLKYSKIGQQPYTNPKNQQKNQVSMSSSDKYSSLIDNKQNSQGISRPSSAVILKVGHHNREISNHSLKNQQLKMNMNNNFSPLARSPTTHDFITELNRNNSKQNLNIRRETPQNYYFTNFDIPKNSNYSQGSRTARPSSTDKMKVNYSSNSSHLNNINNMNTLNQIKSTKYEPEEYINKRGYYLSSKAVDLRQQDYKFKDNEVKYESSTNNYNNSNNKFSACVIYNKNK